MARGRERRDPGKSGCRPRRRDFADDFTFDEERPRERLIADVDCRGDALPVRAAVPIIAAAARSIRASAEMRSPASRRTRSPTTSSAASISRCRPPRTTVARLEQIAESSAARCARCSCTNANAPFASTTTKIATPSCGNPATNARSPAAQSISAKKCVSCPTASSHNGRGRRIGRTLGPSRSRRAAAAASLNPSGSRRSSCCTAAATLLGRRPRFSGASAAGSPGGSPRCVSGGLGRLLPGQHRDLASLDSRLRLLHRALRHDHLEHAVRVRRGDAALVDPRIAICRSKVP